MSWMDSWSRPGKHSATPPPLYLTDSDVKYCAACGRLIGERKVHKQNQIIKYCSDACRKRRLGTVDKRIDQTILALLQGEKDSGIENIDVKSRFRKGDRRNMITCDEIEIVVFGQPVLELGKLEQTVEDDDPYANPDIVAMESQGNKPNPSGPGSEEKRREGQKRADQREMVRRAARRAVVFGLPISKNEHNFEGGQKESPPPRKCEAVMGGQVVEPSFAKGNWAIRWRE